MDVEEGGTGYAVRDTRKHTIDIVSYMKGLSTRGGQRDRPFSDT